eukprot:TRINITY_DN2435_c0_g3_i1.p1 TRINITY_DN2435_c0_g3~~TRINITY_DN2435_c0_g3_i1.p1  ORF type:complete len:578 (-),score=17.93 TRINITY_DN2435_c0_g3_i1:358-1929(-)
MICFMQFQTQHQITQLDKVGEQYVHFRVRDVENLTVQRKLINQQISAQTHPQGIINLLQEKRYIVDYINVTLGMVILARQLRSVKPRRFNPGQILSTRDQNNPVITTKDMQKAYSEVAYFVEEHMEGMDARNIANCLWSFGKAADVVKIHRTSSQERHAGFYYLFGRLSEKLVEFEGNLNGQDAANALWAMSKVGWTDYGDYQVIIERCLKGISFNPQEISNVLQAMAELGHQNVIHIQHFTKLAVNAFKSGLVFKETEVVNLVRSLRILRYYDTSLMRIIELKILKKQWYFGNSDLGSLVLSLADIGVYNKEIIGILVEQFTSQTQCYPQILCNFLYGMAAMQHSIHEVQTAVSYKSVFTNKTCYYKYHRRGLNQLARAYITYQALGTPLYVEPELLLLAQQEAKEECTRRQNLHNPFLDDVYCTVQQYYPQAEQRKHIEEHMCSVHIAIERGDIKIALVLFRCNNYMISVPRVPTGFATAYAQLLQLLGWKVIIVSEITWETNKSLYLQQILQKIEQLLAE